MHTFRFDREDWRAAYSSSDSAQERRGGEGRAGGRYEFIAVTTFAHEWNCSWIPQVHVQLSDCAALRSTGQILAVLWRILGQVSHLRSGADTDEIVVLTSLQAFRWRSWTSYAVGRFRAPCVAPPHTALLCAPPSFVAKISNCPDSKRIKKHKYGVSRKILVRI